MILLFFNWILSIILIENKTPFYASLVDLFAPQQFCKSPSLNEWGNLLRLIWAKSCVCMFRLLLPLSSFLLAQLHLSIKGSALTFRQPEVMYCNVSLSLCEYDLEEQDRDSQTAV